MHRTGAARTFETPPMGGLAALARAAGQLGGLGSPPTSAGLPADMDMDSVDDVDAPFEHGDAAADEEQEGEEAEPEDEEGNGEEGDDDDDDDDDAEDWVDGDDEELLGGFPTDDDLPTDINELRDLAVRLRTKVISLQQSLRARNRRKDFQCKVSEKDKDGNPRTEEEIARLQAASRLRLRCEQMSAKFFKDELQRRHLGRAAIVNRLGLDLSVDERIELRKGGFLSQEWFLAARELVGKLQKLLYNPENSLEMRLSENISIRAMRRMRRVLTEVRDAAGNWDTLVLAHPPLPGRQGGSDPSLKKWMNEYQEIYPKRPVYAPSPLANDHQMRLASRKMLN
eukprot:7380131-Prymnesium_polylepis.1